jgi:EmrB/QacA subfamily drug resistance transporter
MVANTGHSDTSGKTLAIIITGLMTGLLLGSIDQTVVATAGPTIVSDLGGLSLYAWVFSAYILTQTVSMPIFGKLSDLYGRRKFFLLGLAIFMGGSILSGLSQNIDELIVFRAIQGMGSGAFFPVAIAVFGVVVPPKQRGRIQGASSAAFGIATVVGPSIGSFVVQAISWRWIFYINLPLGIVSFILVSLALKETKDAGVNPSVDWLGIFSLTGWIVLLILGFLDGGSVFPWFSLQEGLTFAGSALLFVAFFRIERKAAEPVLPMALFKNRTIASASAVSFLRGIMILGLTTLVPLLVQAGLNGGINDSRNVLNFLLVPLIIGSFIGGNFSTKFSYRSLTSVGMLLTTFGAFLLAVPGGSAGLVPIMEAVAVLGFGVGITFTSTLLAIQYSVDRKLIGVASSLSQFVGNLGGTIGLPILAALQTNAFAGNLSNLLQSLPAGVGAQVKPFLSNSNLVGSVLSSPTALAQALATNPGLAPILPPMRNAFVQSMSPVLWACLGISVAATVLSPLIEGSFSQQMAAQMAAQGEGNEELKKNEPTIPIG